MIKEKFLLMFLFLGGVFLFSILDMRSVKRHDFANKADEVIPFISWFVIPYIALFPFLAFAAFRLFNSPWVVEYFLSMAIAMYTAVVMWWLVPAGTTRPHLSGHRGLERLVMWVYKHDQRRNAFPSSHVFTSLISVWYLSLQYPHMIAVWCVIGGLIAISTLFMKQHYIIDVVVGIFWVASSIFLAQSFLALLG
jgi:membrane-associated phospholipid phosphatase